MLDRSTQFLLQKNIQKTKTLMYMFLGYFPGSPTQAQLFQSRVADNSSAFPLEE